MKFKDNIPIFLQIADYLKSEIFSGRLAMGEKIQPIREIAALMNVNPNTIVKVYSELEREQLIYTERTNGKFVTQDRDVILKKRNEYLSEKTQEFIYEMNKIGVSTEEILEILEGKPEKRN